MKFVIIFTDQEDKKRQKTITSEDMQEAIDKLYEKENVKRINIIKYKG